MFIDQLENPAVSDKTIKKLYPNAYLSQLLSLLFPLRAILILLDGAEEEVDLRDNDFGERVRPCRAVRTWTCASTECTMMRAVR